MMVTKRNFPKADWSKLKQNTSLEMGDVYCQPVATIGAISREKGCELIMCFPKFVNVMKYKIFFDELRKRNPFDNILLVQDNLAVHRN